MKVLTVSRLGAFSKDFHRRFLELLSYQFRDFTAMLALYIDESANVGTKLDSSIQPQPLSKSDLDALLSPFDLKRLESYANNMLDYHVILDLIPRLSTAYFTGQLKSSVKLTPVQQSILLAVGLQRKDVSMIEKELSIESSSQVLAMFIKIMRKMTSHFGVSNNFFISALKDSSHFFSPPTPWGILNADIWM